MRTTKKIASELECLTMYPSIQRLLHDYRNFIRLQAPLAINKVLNKRIIMNITRFFLSRIENKIADTLSRQAWESNCSRVTLSLCFSCGQWSFVLHTCQQSCFWQVSEASETLHRCISIENWQYLFVWKYV